MTTWGQIGIAIMELARLKVRRRLRTVRRNLPSGRTACGGPEESASNETLLLDNDRYACGRSWDG